MNAPLSSSTPPVRVAPNLGHAFGGIWRLTLRRFLLPTHWLTLAGMLLMLFPFSAPVFPARPKAGTPAAAVTTRAASATVTATAATLPPVPLTPAEVETIKRRFMEWVINFYLTFLVPILAFISAGGALRDEMKAGTTDYVFTRPIPRWAFIGFKYVSHLVCAQLDFLCALGVVYAIGNWRHVPGLGDAMPAILGTQVLVVAAFSALGFLAAVITSKYIIVGLAYGAIIEIGVGQIPTQLSRLSMTHQVQGLLKRFIPVDPAELANQAPTMVVAAPGAFTTVTVLIAISIVLLVIAAAIFSFLELISHEEA